jgi:CRP-like cAMP-binding protein
MTVPVGNRSPVPAVADLKGAFRVDRHSPDAVIYRAAEAGERVHLLKSGRVRLLHARGGERAVTAILRPGDVFGEAFRADGGPSEEVAVAATECEVWSIDPADFHGQMEARPELVLEVCRAYSERVRALQLRLLALTFKEVPSRLADTLLHLAEGHGERCPHGGEIDLRGITQQDLADLVGASRSFVSTLINEMKRDGMLGNVGRTVCLRDLRALKKLASQEK